MSAKNRRDEKKIRTLRRALRKGRQPTQTDLLKWLELHGHADTAGAARKLILERRVRASSHVLGFRILEDEETKEKWEAFWPLVNSNIRPEIYVSERG